MSHYYAERMFSPVLVSPTFKVDVYNHTLSKDEVEVYVISELLEEIKNVGLEISVQRFDNINDAHVKNIVIGKWLKLTIYETVITHFDSTIVFNAPLIYIYM